MFKAFKYNLWVSYRKFNVDHEIRAAKMVVVEEERRSRTTNTCKHSPIHGIEDVIVIGNLDYLNRSLTRSRILQSWHPHKWMRDVFVVQAHHSWMIEPYIELHVNTTGSVQAVQCFRSP